jgi:hypothetical protein
MSDAQNTGDTQSAAGKTTTRIRVMNQTTDMVLFQVMADDVEAGSCRAYAQSACMFVVEYSRSCVVICLDQGGKQLASLSDFPPDPTVELIRADGGYKLQIRWG